MYGKQLAIQGSRTVDIAEARSNREVRADGAESLVDLVDILRLSVQAIVVDGLVVDTVLFAASDADFHLQPFLTNISLDS